MKIIKIFLSVPLFILAFTAMAHGSLEHLVTSLDLYKPHVYAQKYITGGQPSQADLNNLANAGVETVINLRGKGEFSEFNEQAVVEALGMKYISIPVASVEDISTTNVKKFQQSLAKIKGKVLVHCASGNRVGAFFTLKSYLFDHKNSDQAIQIGKQTGLTRLEGYVKKVMLSSATTK